MGGPVNGAEAYRDRPHSQDVASPIDWRVLLRRSNEILYTHSECHRHQPLRREKRNQPPCAGRESNNTPQENTSTKAPPPLRLFGARSSHGLSATASGLCVLATHADAPVVPEPTVSADLLQSLKVLTQLRTKVIRESLDKAGVEGSRGNGQ